MEHDTHPTDPSRSGNPYVPIVLHLVPRILTSLDRDRDSPTYGCFDREFWHYKTLDYSSGLLQQSSLVLALVYAHDFPDNIYYRRQRVRDWAVAGVRFCERIQNRDGSFPEYWKGEVSFPSTAFTLYSICEATDLLGTEPDAAVLTKAAEFLIAHTEAQALNQEMAAIAAIGYAGKLLGNARYREIAGKRFDALLGRKSPEGWFSEYGGFDVSYLTVTLDFMMRYHELAGDPRAIAAAGEMVGFIRYFVHPDGSTGGEYGTRNTEYFAPYGLEAAKKHHAAAGAILDRLFCFIHREGYLNLPVDERYLLHYLGHSFAKALTAYDNRPCPGSLPCDTAFAKYFAGAGICIRSTGSYYCIASLRKGGVFRVFDRATSQMSTDGGCRLRTAHGLFVTEMPRDNEMMVGPDTARASGRFVRMNFQQQSTAKLAALRLLSAVCGRSTTRLLKRILIIGTEGEEGMRFCRTISFGENHIGITDQIDIGGGSGTVRMSDGLSVRYVPSSRFFQINSLENAVAPSEYPVKGRATIERTLTFGD